MPARDLPPAPARPAAALTPWLKAIAALHADTHATSAVIACAETWLSTLTACGSAPPEDRRAPLFVTHSFLIAVTRLIASTLEHPGAAGAETIDDGTISWIRDTPAGRRAAAELAHAVSAWDWRRSDDDVMRALYMDTVPAADRREFGEHHTPRWLAAAIVEHLLDDAWLERAAAAAATAVRAGRATAGIGVLDPACGSGAFLHQAARRIVNAPAFAAFDPATRATLAAALIHGLDVHPVAVEMARTNVLRALPPCALPEIDVHAADALAADTGDGRPLFETADSVVVPTPGGGEVVLPAVVAHRPDFAMAAEAIADSAVTGDPVPAQATAGLTAADAAAVRTACWTLSRGLTVPGARTWKWRAANAAAAHRLSSLKVDRIAANPPWLTLAGIRDRDRKKAMERMGRALGVHEGGTQAPHTDVASYFVIRTRELYLAARTETRAAWIVSNAALRSGQWGRFRARHRALTQSVDLADVRVFGSGDSRRSCLLLDGHAWPGGGSAAAVRARPFDKKHPPREDDSPKIARAKFSLEPVRERPPCRPSGYLHGDGRPLFEIGATMLPCVLTLISARRPARRPGETTITTTRSTHEPWSKIEPLTLDVPDAWIVPLYRVTRMTPFHATHCYAIAPLDGDGRLTANPAAEHPSWKTLETVYAAHAGAGRHTPRTLLERIDFQETLWKQTPIRDDPKRRTVVHPKSGDFMRAARLPSKGGVVDAGLLSFQTSCADEARYLTAILNAPCLQQAFADARDSGRDFQTTPWRKIPIPRYNPRNAVHARLARLTKLGERRAAELMSTATPNESQVSASRKIRKALANGVFPRIDECVRKIAPSHAAAASRRPPTGARPRAGEPAARGRYR